MNNLLKLLENKLNDQGYQSYLVPLDEKMLQHQIVIDLDSEINLKLTIFIIGDLISLSSDHAELNQISKELSDANVDFLQLFIRFPFGFLKETIPDLARLILMANWSTPIGAFGLNEAQNIIFYRHVFERLGEEPGVNLIVEAVNAMAFYAKLRFESLEIIASGEKTLAGYLRDLDEENLRSEEFPGYDL
ncbi:MAG: hypothetical protein Q7U53_11800 [Anaerolineaceae bacterium]|nr:hypothetical protein [Anaerolineaceae bacterium]